MQSDALNDLIAVANETADAAWAPILRHFRSRDLSADNKLADGYDPVTVADRGAETAMRAVLAARRPQDSIFGEEQGRSSGDSGLTWVLDPIDGTRAFLAGAPTFGVLVALQDDATGRPFLGIVDQPYIGERFIGVEGRGAALIRNGDRHPIRTRRRPALDEAILLTTFPEVGTPRDREGFRAVSRSVRLTRYGLDCYGYMLVALGQADLVIETGLAAYDIQGPMAVVEAAGGVVTDWRGGPCAGGGQVVAAGCPALHAAALERLAPFAA